MGNEISSPATGTGDTSTRDSYVDYEWSSPSKISSDRNSEGYWVEVDSYNKDNVIYDARKIIGLFDALLLLLFVHKLGRLVLTPTKLVCFVIYGSSPIKKGDDESIHFCVKMDREFLYVLTFLSLLYLLTQFSKKDFLKKFLASLVTRRKRSLDDIHLGAFCIISCLN